MHYIIIYYIIMHCFIVVHSILIYNIIYYGIWRCIVLRGIALYVPSLTASFDGSFVGGWSTGAPVIGPSIESFARWFIGCVIDRLRRPFAHSYFHPVIQSLLGTLVDDSLICWLIPRRLLDSVLYYNIK